MDTIKDENLRLRKLLWLNHGHYPLYGDDGEMQCQACMVDFKRTPVELIEQRFFDIANGIVNANMTQCNCRNGYPQSTGGCPVRGLSIHAIDRHGSIVTPPKPPTG